MDSYTKKIYAEKYGYWALLSLEGKAESDFRGASRQSSDWRVFVAPKEWTPKYSDSNFPGEQRTRELPGDMRSVYHRSWKKKKNYKFERNQLEHKKHESCIKINKNEDHKTCIIDVGPGAIHFNARYIEDVPVIYLEDEIRCIDPDLYLANKLFFENEYMYERDPRYLKGHDWNCDSNNENTRGRPEYRK